MTGFIVIGFRCGPDLFTRDSSVVQLGLEDDSVVCKCAVQHDVGTHATPDMS